VIKIKKIIFLILISSIFIEKGNTEINDALYMTVANRPITQSDIVNEIKILLILNNEIYSEDKRDRLQEIAVQTIIKRNIKQMALDRNNFFEFNQRDLEKELINFATNLNTDLDTLKNVFESNELDFSIIENQVKVELSWNSLIFQLYKDRISINPDEIDEQLKLFQKKEITEYLISEILIKKAVDENKLEIEIEELKNKIKIDGFENVAKSLSISVSAIKGGDLGWLNENIISNEIKSAIINAPVGSLSKPILLPEGILIFKIRDKRKIKKNLSLEEAKNQLVKDEKGKILNMHSLSHYDKLRRSVSIKFTNE